MMKNKFENSAVRTAIIINSLPPSLKNSLIADSEFCKSHGIEGEIFLALGNTSLLIKRSELYQCIRKLFDYSSKKRRTFRDAKGQKWKLGLLEKDGLRQVTLNHEDQQFILPDFYPLSSNANERLMGFKQLSDKVFLPQFTIAKWEEILSDRVLSDDELDEFNSDIEDTPVHVAIKLSSEIRAGKGSLASLVPRSERYFKRLIGECSKDQNIAEYAVTGAKKHISNLMSWKPFEGFLSALLLSSYPSIPSMISCTIADELQKEELVKAYEWLQKKGDLISQTGAIEIGIALVDKYPQIESILKIMVERIKNENPDTENNRFRLLSTLMILVDGEVSRTKILRHESIYWRRLASIAHASLIERSIIRSPVDVEKFSDQIIQTWGAIYYFQNYSDLRLEPRWYPEFTSPRQLRTWVLSRILNIALQNESKIKSTSLFNLLLGEEVESIKNEIEYPATFLPGPLEGGLDLQIDPPEETIKQLEASLKKNILQPGSFISLVNTALIFRLDSYQAELAAKALRDAKYQLNNLETELQQLFVLKGLAMVSAITRCTELAKGIKILTQKYIHVVDKKISIEESISVGLIAAASFQNKTEWCKFVGDWLTDLAFQELKADEINLLYSSIVRLCEIVPELWYTCSRAEAALSACLGI